MGKQEYLSAGRFAALVGTTKETLFHYDEIGLFVPKTRGKNGYRYYAMDQIETFDVIGMLRELGMPLSEIRRYLEQRSPEKFGVLLDQEEKVVREKIQRLREMQRWIREKKRFLAQSTKECKEAFRRDPACPVRTQQLPEQYLVTNHSETADNLTINQKIGELYAYCGKYGNRSSYNVGFIQERKILEQGIFLDYRDFYLLFDHVPAKVAYTVRPAGTYLCYYYQGPWQEIAPAYQNLFRYAEKEGILLEDRFYEEYMKDALTSMEMEQYITRIAVKIKSYKNGWKKSDNITDGHSGETEIE